MSDTLGVNVITPTKTHKKEKKKKRIKESFIYNSNTNPREM
jgi:hypothetical protein